MMQELFDFVQLGFRHITDLAAMDHLLFLLALAAIYRPSDWRRALWVISAFTVGHSVTLALAVSGAIALPTQLVEFLIPVTIVATCVENIVVAGRERARWRSPYRPVLAGVFGLVHGAGFANYLRDLFADRIALPLFGFNLGIELGQIVVLAVAAVVMVSADRMIELVRRAGRQTPLRLRAVAISSVILMIAARWAVERNPW